MADPLSMVSAISAIVSLADVVFGTSLKLYKIVFELRAASKEIQILAYSLRVCTTIAQQSRTFSTDLQSSPFVTEDGLTLGGLHDALKAFEGALSTIDQIVQEQDAPNSSVLRRNRKKLKWVSNTQKIRSAQQNLDRASQSLVTALSLVNGQGSISLRNQIDVSTCKDGQQHQEVRLEIGNLGQTLETYHDEHDQSLLQFSRSLDRNRKDILDGQIASQDAVSQSLQRIGSSLTTSQILMGGKVESLQTEICQNHAKTTGQIYSGNQQLQRSLASIERKLVMLTIAQELEEDSYALFADQNPKALLLPLMLMDGHLIPFITELTRSRRVNIDQQNLENIYDQFQELLASCYEASARFTRSERKRRYRRSIRDGSSSASENIDKAIRSMTVTRKLRQQEPRGYHAMCNRKRTLKSQRSGVWIKRLPHGLLKIQVAPIWWSRRP